MLNEVKATIDRYGLIPRDAVVIAAVSGGADSVALLDILCSLRCEYGISLVIAHLNHGIRGAEAQRDEDFVVSLSAKYSLPIEVRHVDCPAEAALTGEGLEECGRRLRYRFFSELSEKYGGALTATAHNADDNAETVLFNMTRGSSLAGLCGIPLRRGNIIRPLLYSPRSEIELYCKANSLQYMTDSTNADTAYSRNAIRANVIPQLKELNPSFISAVTRMCELNRRDESFLTELAQGVKCIEGESCISYDAAQLKELDPAVRSRVYILAYRKMLSSLPRGAVQLEEIDSVLFGGGAVQLTGELFAGLCESRLTFYKPVMRSEKPSDLLLPALEGEFIFGKYKITLTKHNYSEKINFSEWENSVDCDTISSGVVLRTRTAGDEITLAKRKVTKSLKKLFCETGVPAEERDLIPVLSDGEKVLWVLGAGVNRPCALTDKTKTYITVRGERYAQ